MLYGDFCFGGRNNCVTEDAGYEKDAGPKMAGAGSDFSKAQSFTFFFFFPF